MITVNRENDVNTIKALLTSAFCGRGGYYCYNIELIREITDGSYRIRNFLHGVHAGFFIALEEDIPIVIAPIEIAKKSASPIGVSECFDFVDFFYRNDIDEKTLHLAYLEIFRYMKNQGIKEIVWNYVPEDSFSKKVLEKQYNTACTEVDNVRIQFIEYEEYFKSLSKSTRQNLRTAKNRITKDGRQYSLVTNLEANLPLSTIADCISIYSTRQGNKYGKGFLNRISANTIHYTTSMMRKNAGVLFALEIDRCIAAFMFGYVNSVKNSIEVPKLAINEDYAFYSPGMVLIDETIEYLQKNTDIRTLDLCRGTENYKLKMGGEIYKTYSFTIKL